MEAERASDVPSPARPFDARALLLALVPALGYVYSFIYERSYAHYFAIPTDLITISVEVLDRKSPSPL